MCFFHDLPVLAMRAARLLHLSHCSVQCTRQQLFAVRIDAALRAHVPDLIRAVRSVHMLSHGHVRSVSMSMKYRVSFHCLLYKVQHNFFLAVVAIIIISM